MCCGGSGAAMRHQVNICKSSRPRGASDSPPLVDGGRIATYMSRMTGGSRRHSILHVSLVPPVKQSFFVMVSTHFNTLLRFALLS